MLIATFLAWFIIDLAPGDFASQFALDPREPGKAERLRASMGLDQPGVIRLFWFYRPLSWLISLPYLWGFTQPCKKILGVTASLHC
jgi:peptide/nickel transport system permease protein